MTLKKRKKTLGHLPYLNPFPLDVMRMACTEFLFSHILLSLPLIPTLSTSDCGKALKKQNSCGVHPSAMAFKKEKKDGQNYKLATANFSV